MQGRWHTGNCHGRTVVAAIAAVIVLGAACATARAVAAIPWYVWTAITATVAAVVIGERRPRRRCWSAGRTCAANRRSPPSGPSGCRRSGRSLPQFADHPTLPLPVIQRQALEAPVVNHYHIHYHGESSPVRAQTGEEL